MGIDKLKMINLFYRICRFIKFVKLKYRFKYLFALLVAVYLMGNIGIPVYYHYCGGELESINAMFKNDNCCGEEEEEDSDCCQNETKIITQKSESSFSHFNVNLKPDHIDLSGVFNSNVLPKPEKIEVIYVNTLLSELKIPDSGRSILKSKSVLII